jgi:hypothetical protein
MHVRESMLRVAAILGGGVCAPFADAFAVPGTASCLQVQPLHHAEAPVLVLAAGEIDAAHAGPELLAVDAGGTIYRLDSGEPAWTVQLLPIAVDPSLHPGDRHTANIGDVHAGFPGNEIVLETGSSSGTISTLVQAAPGAWDQQIVFDGTKLVGLTWGVRIGDIDAGRAGLELFHIHEGILDSSTGYFVHRVGGAWQSQPVYQGEVGMDSAIGDSNPAVPGNEIVIGTEMGPVYEITPQPGNPELWPRRTLWNIPAEAPWTLRIADVLPDLAGNEIVYGTRPSNRVLLSHEMGDAHQVEILFTGEAKGTQMNMWDIAVSDIEPASPSLEIVAVDDPGFAYLVRHDGSSWSGEPLWQDPGGALYAVVAADFLPQAPGDEIVVAGASGAITLLSRSVPGDTDCDGVVGIIDLLAVLGAWGPCPPPREPCSADVTGNGQVDVLDLLTVLASWSQ